MRATKPDTFYGLSAAGGLGWGFGAALGAKLAAPDKLVVATLGDGAYMFANPMVAHWVSDVHKLPILTIVFNNSLYGAVRGATMSMFKDGVAGEDGGRFMADLSPSPAFEAAVKAQGGHGERVEKAVRSAGGARPRPRRRGQGEAPGAAQCDLPAVDAVRQPLTINTSTNREPPLKQTRQSGETTMTMRVDAYTHFIPKRFYKEVMSAGDAQGHRQADDGRAVDLRPQRPQEGRRQVQGLQPDPVLPDAAVRADDQDPASRPRNTPRSSTTASPSSAPRTPTISPAGWRRRRWRRPTSASARPPAR